MGFDGPGIILDRPMVMLSRSGRIAARGGYAPEAVMGSRQARCACKRTSIALGRLVKLSGTAVRLAEIDVIGRAMRGQRNGAADMLACFRIMSVLIGDNTQQVMGIRVCRFGLQNAAVTGLRLGKPIGLMQGDRVGEPGLLAMDRCVIAPGGVRSGRRRP